MNLIQRLKRYFLGYDFFISYSRSDGNDYALALANSIIEKGYTCYLDQWGSEPGQQIPTSLKKKLLRSSVLVVLGTPKGCASKAIKEEIILFLKTKRVIIPVDLGMINEAIWFTDIEGLAIQNECDQNSQSSITNELLNRLVNALTYTKQSKRIVWASSSAALLLISALAGILIVFLQLNMLQEEFKEVNSSLSSVQSNLHEKQILLREREDSLEAKNKAITLANQLYADGRLKLEQMRISTDSIIKKADSAEKRAEQMSDMANDLQENSNELLELVESNIQGLYEQPNLNDYHMASGNEQFPARPLTIHCRWDKATISLEGKKLLDQLIACAKSLDTYQVHVSTFVSSRYWVKDASIESRYEIGLISRTDDYSMMLSKHMAKTMVNYLVSQGLERSSIISKGFGEDESTYPLSPMNNRYEVLLVPQ